VLTISKVSNFGTITCIVPAGLTHGVIATSGTFGLNKWWEAR